MEWEMSLCNNCIRESFQYHLQHTRHRATREILGDIALSVGAVIGIVLVAGLSWYLVGRGDLADSIKFLWGLPILLGFLGFAAWQLINFPRMLSSSLAELRRARELAKTDPEEQVDKAFDGEAQRILKSLQAGNHDLLDRYSLPNHRSDRELPDVLVQRAAREGREYHNYSRSWKVHNSVDSIYGIVELAPLTEVPMAVAWKSD